MDLLGSLTDYVNGVKRILWNQGPRQLQGSSIRLLKLKPSKCDGPIECELVYEELDVNPVYTALSYVWGDTTDPGTIICDGQKIEVRRNLHDVLWRFRELDFPESSNLLWIDAICINQQDVEEKTDQVKRMTEIYLKASLVIAWLGETGQNDIKGLELIDKLYKIYVDDPDFKLQPGNPGLPGFNQNKINGFPDGNDPAWDGLLEICENDWFARVWIIQELLVSRSCRFLRGGRFLDSKVLLTLGEKLADDTLYLSIIAGPRGRNLGECNAGHLSKLASVQKELGKRPLLVLLAHTIRYRATDKRDRVFALMALASDGDISLIDYSTSTPDVMIKTAQHVLKQTELGWSHYMLSHAGILEQEEGTPSWVPNWASEGPSSFECNPIFADPVLNGTKPVFTFLADNTLLLKGKTIDRITAVQKRDWTRATNLIPTISATPSSATPFDNSDKFMHDMIARHQSAFTFLAQLPSYPTGHSVSSVYWHSLTFDNSHSDKMDYVDYWKRLSYTAGALTTFIRSASAITEMGPNPMQTDPIMFLMAMGVLQKARMEFIPAITAYQSEYGKMEEKRNVSFGRSLCITEHGYVGWMHPKAEVGDEIVVFEAWDVPFVVRRVGDDGEGKEERYKLIGDCYLHGLMSREGLDMPEAEMKSIFLV